MKLGNMFISLNNLERAAFLSMQLPPLPFHFSLHPQELCIDTDLNSTIFYNLSLDSF